MPKNDDLDGLSECSEEGGQPGVVACKKVKHFLKIQLTHKDDGSKVKAAKCRVTKGDTVIMPGPLANGVLNKSTLEPGTYDVSFPDIDASEWGPAPAA